MNPIPLEPATPAQRFGQIQEFMAEEPAPGTVNVLVEHGIENRKFGVENAARSAANPLPEEALLVAAFGPDGHYEQFVLTLHDHVTITVVCSPGAGKLETIQWANLERVAAADRKLAIIRRIRKTFKVFDGASIAAHLGPELARFYEIREATLGRLESTLTSVIEQVARYTSETEARYTEREKAREQRLEEQRAKLHEEHAARQRALEQELEASQAALETRATALDQRAAELDDRDNTHARRQLRQDVKGELARRSSAFTLSAGTSDKRWPVKLLCFMLMAFSAVGLCAVIFGWTTNASEWVNAVRQLFFAGTFSATAVFYLRWENQWFQQHANEEFRLKRLDLDIDRASWVVETTLEYKHENREIPPELLKDLSRNLFAEPLSMGTVRHPVESLGDALLGASSQVRMKMGDAQVELDRKGMKKFEQSAMGEGD